MHLFVYLFLTFLFCAPTSFAMEVIDENTSRIKEEIPSLTLEEAAELWRKRDSTYIPDEKKFMKMFVALLVVDALLTVVPGLMPVIPITLRGCPEVFASNSDDNFLATNASLAGNSTDPYSQQTRDMCYAGLAFLSLPTIAYISTILFYPIFKLHVVRAKHKNKLLDENIEDFMKGRLQKNICDENDIRCLGQMLLENDEVLDKLSTSQALILAEVNFEQFCQKNRFFSKSACEYANKLMGFLEMKESELIRELGQENVRKILKEEPSLWQALVRLSSSTDEKVIDALKKSLRAALPFSIDHDDQQQIDEIFRNVTTGISINDIIAKQAFIERYERDKKVTIIYGNKVWNISEKRLVEISDFFKAALQNSCKKQSVVANKTLHRGDSLMVSLLPSAVISDKHEIDLSEIDWDLVDVLIKIAFDNEVQINKKNISVILDAASHFRMNSLMALCDSYIKENHLADQRLKVYQEGNGLSRQPGIPSQKNNRSNE